MQNLKKLTDMLEQLIKTLQQNVVGNDNIDDEKGFVNCLCCNKQLEFNDYEQISHGGELKIEFGYGSRFDQGGGIGDVDSQEDQMSRLLACDVIKAYICDDCFEAKTNIVKGYIRTRSELKRKI